MMVPSLLPPRWAERLLDASGADPELREVVLGDLFQEFTERAHFDGADAARRWYAAEALRTVPHLIGQWATRLRVLDALKLAGAVLISYCVVVLIGATFAGVIRLGLSAWMLDPEIGRFAPYEALVRVSGLVTLILVSATMAVAGGYTAARVGFFAPLAAAFGLGVFWCSLMLSALAFMHGKGVETQQPFMSGLAAVALVIGGTVAGGVLRVCTSGSSRAP